MCIELIDDLTAEPGGRRRPQEWRNAAMKKQFWMGLIAGIAISGIVGGLIGVSMVGKKATVAPSDWEAFVVNKLKTMKIPEAQIPADPIEMTNESLIEGGEHYNHHCAVCHDLEGDADSQLAEAFNPPVADLTSEHIQSYSDGQLKWIVDNGIRFTGMPGWDALIEDDTQWKIVYYMRALADPEKAKLFESVLRERGKWKVEPPAAGDHPHEATEHGDVHEH
jgi:mono/diheme cytochrome c family protein